MGLNGNPPFGTPSPSGVGWLAHSLEHPPDLMYVSHLKYLRGLGALYEGGDWQFC